MMKEKEQQAWTGRQEAWVLASVLQLTCYVPLGKPVVLSGPLLSFERVTLVNFTVNPALKFCK